jgi:membrane-associated phospholipid phosphatase
MAFWEANAGLLPAVTRPLNTLRNSLTWRHGVFAAVLAVYALMTALIVVGSPLNTLDANIAGLHLHQRWPGINRFMLDYVMLGQRAPSTLLALPWFLWICHRHRSLTPLIRLATALLLLNVSVGMVKIWTGRYGPHGSSDAHHVFAGGNIFPSGHAANAVVLYGAMAMSVFTYRRTAAVLAAVICSTVGLTTLYLNTHWLSDVVAAWLAGGLVLMVLPTCVPYVERAVHAVIALIVRLFTSRRSAAPTAWVPSAPATRPPRRRSPATGTMALRPRALRGAAPAVRTAIRDSSRRSASRTDSTVS